MAGRIGNRGASANFTLVELALHISHITWQLKYLGNNPFPSLAAIDPVMLLKASFLLGFMYCR
jgi:hypothetical protein